jgi:enoyl-CoA hydratase/carnithine racemase
MPTQDVEITREGPITRLRLNRPAKRNALTVAMYTALADALVAAETDGTTVIVISGAGQGFCAGNDLADFVANGAQGEDAPVGRFLRAIINSSRILVAAVQGKAVGVGTTMLLHCDFVIADQDAILHMPFTDLALVPEAASSLLVPRLLGQQRAAELLILGEQVPAARAETLGLVNKVVPNGTALQEAEAIAARVLAKPRSSVLATKRLMKSPTTDIPGRMYEEAEAFAAGLQSPEFAAIAAQFFARAKVA